MNDKAIIATLEDRCYQYFILTGNRPKRIKLGANRLRDYREEARLRTQFDTFSEDSYAGARIVPARHPDDIIIDAGEGET